MGVSKVEYSGRTLIDLTADTVTPESLLEGVTAHNAAGEVIVGRLSVKNFIETIYPVGSIYTSTNSTSPAELFGVGTWERIKDQFLLAAGDQHEAGTTGGSESHTHNYGIQYGGYYREVALEMNPNGGALKYDSSGNITLATEESMGNQDAPVNASTGTTMTTASMTHYRSIGNTSYTANMPPYITVYVWKRTA